MQNIFSKPLQNVLGGFALCMVLASIAKISPQWIQPAPFIHKVDQRSQFHQWIRSEKMAILGGGLVLRT